MPMSPFYLCTVTNFSVVLKVVGLLSLGLYVLYASLAMFRIYLERMLHGFTSSIQQDSIFLYHC